MTQMKVSLLNYTGKGFNKMYAAKLLVFTKNTRLNMTANNFDDMDITFGEIMKELEYMSNTIPSSWEFLDYIFVIEGVGRGFTHQFVRTRQGSYAQQSMRVTDMSGFEYVTPPNLKDEALIQYEHAMNSANQFYQLLIQLGAEIQDARGVLPTNICTNIVAKFNLRTISEMAQKRSSIRTQDEYRLVLDEMINCVLEVHPWAHLFMRNKKMDAAKELEQFIIKEVNDRIASNNYLSKETQTHFVKMIDMLRGV